MADNSDEERYRYLQLKVKMGKAEASEEPKEEGGVASFVRQVAGNLGGPFAVAAGLYDAAKGGDPLTTAKNTANEINYGLLSSVPGLQPLAAEFTGIGEDRAVGNPTMEQGAERMVGMAAGASTMMLSVPLRVMGAANYFVEKGAAHVVESGFKASIASFVQNTAKAATTSPIKFATIEATSAAAAGAAGAGVYEMTEDPYLRAAAELVGGTAVGFIGPMFRAATSITPVGMIARQLRSVFSKDRLSLGKGRAAARIRRASDNPDRVLSDAKNADVLPEANLTLIEKSGDRGLLSLEASVRSETDKLNRTNQDRFAQINGVIRNEFETLEGDAIGDAKVVADDARAYLSYLMNERVRIAGVKVEERLSAIGNPNAATASKFTREEIDLAYDAGSKQEDELWKATNKALPSPATKSLEEYQTILSEMKGNRVTEGYIERDIPIAIKQQLGREVRVKGEDGTMSTKWVPGKIAENTTVGELQALRKELLRESRAERAKDAPNREKLRVIARLQGKVLEDMQAVQGDETLDLARGFSQDFNTTFRTGDVGRILGYEVTGGASVDPLMTLQSTLGKSKLASGAAVDNLLAAADLKAPGAAAAVGNRQVMMTHMRDYVLDEFMRAASVNGELNLVKAKTFANSKREVLERLPEAKKLIDEAIQSQNLLNIERAAIKGNKSAAAIILNSPPEREIARLKASTNLDGNLKELKILLETDETGRAAAGWRRAIIDDLFASAETTKFDSQGNALVGGFALRKAMNDPQMKKIFSEFLSKDQIARLNRIANTAQARELGAEAEKSIEPIMDDSEGLIANFARRFLAAASTRILTKRLGLPGTIQSVSFGVKLSEGMRKMGLDPARELIIDAVTSQDDKLLRSILRPESVSEKFRYTQQQAWIAATATKLGISLTDEEE